MLGYDSNYNNNHNSPHVLTVIERQLWCVCFGTHAVPESGVLVSYKVHYMAAPAKNPPGANGVIKRCIHLLSAPTSVNSARCWEL